MIPDRSLEVLRAIVHDYIETNQPVGSKSLVERHSFGVSSATIRNEMALLEEEQLIVAPHTSSGRVPTDKGYRLFVDRLGEVKPLSIPERSAIETFMQGSSDLDEVLGRTVRLLSQLTNQMAVVQYPTLGRAVVKSIELVPVSESKVLIILITDANRIQQHVIDLGSDIDAPLLAELRARLLDESYPKPFVIDDGKSRFLYFNVRLMQSEMSLKAPNDLAIRYTQKMMACLLFKPKPKRARWV